MSRMGAGLDDRPGTNEPDAEVASRRFPPGGTRATPRTADQRRPDSERERSRSRMRSNGVLPRDTIISPNLKFRGNPRPQPHRTRLKCCPRRPRSGLIMRGPVLRPFPAKTLWAIAGGTIGLLVLAVGGDSLAPFGGSWRGRMSPAPRGTQSGKPETRAQSSDSVATGARIAIRNPSEKRIASTPTGDASGCSFATGPQARYADGQPKPASGSASRRTASARAGLYLSRGVTAGKSGRGYSTPHPRWRSWPSPTLTVGRQNAIFDYAAIFTEASNHGIMLVGYVSTDYGSRPQAEIKNDVDAWIRFYPQIRGFFFDQQPRESQYAAQFRRTSRLCEAKIPDPLVITNPGVPCDEAYLAQAVSNVTCVFVNYQGFEQFELPATLKAYDPSRFAAMPYNIPDVETMRTVVKEAIIKRIGYLYVSDAKPPNQWGKLPVYWEAEVDAVSRVR